MKQRVYRNLPEPMKPVARRLYRFIQSDNRLGDDIYFDSKYFIKSMGITNPVIIDAGANVGRVTEVFLDQYASPIIHAIEPVPNHIEKLEEKFSDNENVIIHKVAVGADKETISFNITKKSDTSSIFHPSKTKFRLREKVDRDEAYRVSEEIRVPQVRLEDITEKADLVKLDLQGGELAALKGIENLQSVSVIITETMFLPLYDNQPLFCDINKYLKENGFQMFNLYGFVKEPTGQLSNVDVLYLNTKFLDDAMVLKEQHI